MTRPRLLCRRSLLAALGAGLGALLPEATPAHGRLRCGKGRQRCPGPSRRRCADLATDRDNCGVCGHGCADGETCRAGVCSAVSVCTALCTICHACAGGTCQPQPDGTPCGIDGSCRAGACEPTPPSAPACPSDGPSGVHGTVLLGPTCPVERPDTPCPDRPLATSLLVRDGLGRTVCATSSGADGTFRAALPPGSYTLGPADTNPRPFPRGESVDAVVTAGQWTEVVVRFDSGIR